MEKTLLRRINSLMHSRQVQKIFQWLFHLCQTISDEMNLSTQSHQEHVCAATLEYIQQHYPENTLCLNEIAEMYILVRRTLVRYLKSSASKIFRM